MDKNKKRPERTLDGDPLATCPDDLKVRHESKKVRAARQRSAAIKLKCLECCCWQEAEVRRCEIVDCALHHLR